MLPPTVQERIYIVILQHHGVLKITQKVRELWLLPESSGMFTLEKVVDSVTKWSTLRLPCCENVIDLGELERPRSTETPEM